MDDDIGLGYPAGVVSLKSPTYGRLWLSIAHHPGAVVSSMQAEALALARRPHRRTARYCCKASRYFQLLCHFSSNRN